MLKTSLYDLHVRLGAKMVEFAGWEMPLLYKGIVEEHHHTRRAASVFDVSHMGRLNVRGNGAEALLQRVCTRQLGDMKAGQSRYSQVCQERGGILDDVIVSKHDKHWQVVCNASNRPVILPWLNQHAGKDAEVTDQTESTLMIAIQGPKAIDLTGGMLPIPIGDLKRYHFTSGSYMGIPYTISRTGYTGEDGIEVILPAAAAQFLTALLSGDRDDGFRPAGLGARDTLRMEAGMPLYGHELHDKIDPISAGLAWCVDLKKDFIGAEVLRTIAQAGSEYQLIGLELEGRRIARQNTPILVEQHGVGKVSSGTFSPTLQKSIAMAFVQRTFAGAGTKLTVELGGAPVAAKAVPLPFFKRPTA